jgi:hypothetical protein
MRASGWMPRFSAASALISSVAAAPSLMPEALAAVTEPSLVKAGRSFCIASMVAPWRMYSSAVDHDVALAGLDRDRRDLVGELAGLLRGLGLVLGGDGELVLHVAGDLPLLGHVLGGLAHVVAVERVPQPVADHRVDEFQVAHLVALRAGRGMGAQDMFSCPPATTMRHRPA